MLTDVSVEMHCPRCGKPDRREILRLPAYHEVEFTCSNCGYYVRALTLRDRIQEKKVGHSVMKMRNDGQPIWREYPDPGSGVAVIRSAGSVKLSVITGAVDEDVLLRFRLLATDPTIESVEVRVWSGHERGAESVAVYGRKVA